MATGDYAEDCEDDEKKRKKGVEVVTSSGREKNVNSNRAELPIHVVDSDY